MPSKNPFHTAQTFSHAPARARRNILPLTLIIEGQSQHWLWRRKNLIDDRVKW